MDIGIVVGNIVSTIKHPAYKGSKLLLVEAVNPDLSSRNDLMVAIDSVDAGEGDVVLVAREGKAANDILGTKLQPVRSVVVGVIDHFILDKKKTYAKK